MKNSLEETLFEEYINVEITKDLLILKESYKWGKFFQELQKLSDDKFQASEFENGLEII